MESTGINFSFEVITIPETVVRSTMQYECGKITDAIPSNKLQEVRTRSHTEIASMDRALISCDDRGDSDTTAGRSGSRLHYRSVRCPTTQLRGNWAPDRDLDQRSVGPIPRSRDQATNADHCCRGHRNLLDRRRPDYIRGIRMSGDGRARTVPAPTNPLGDGPDPPDGSDPRDGPDPRDAERRLGSSCY